MPGAAWWVEGPRGLRTHGCCGHAQVTPHPVPLTEDTPFDLASLTKPLATALVWVLLEQDGVTHLEEPICRFLPELRGSAWERATLVDLAAHRAGLPAWRPLYIGGASEEEYLREIALGPRTLPPDTTLYSDLGYLLLGFALARVTGQSLSRVFADRVAAPLRLERTGFATDVHGAGAAATEVGNDYERMLAGTAGHGHGFRRHLLRGEVHDANAHGLGGAAGHAGLFGTVGEVARIAREIVSPWRLDLGPEARARLLRPVTAGAGRTFGFVCADASRAGRGVLPRGAVGHAGFTGTSVWLDPEGGEVYVLLTNRVHPRVDERDFGWVRRGFHRVARSAR